LEELKKQDIEIDGLHTSEVALDQNHNYVLVMDEINRGNISKIFGELITLIEDDKRAGKSDARELTLPYSKESFTVPSNLYLIGTMNTADKSLTQLDLALRRRFEFKEIGPDSQILEDMEASQHDVDIPQMLKKMNQRI
ncbi:MAG: AAA family ATPase, partial [Acinetobacter sp.]|nr:AAA family ATPase [Acinetobacter sp.]